ncbi:NAD(P)/FAD-dependent oxidoreductase [Pseudohongiella nitratireducens]|uniref:NAD(P)/FAD-dependent oxidoreductase n=1 Tax=Pseudohongiella nitratireducens TaxID=1768907 RepID=UPI0030EE8468
MGGFLIDFLVCGAGISGLLVTRELLERGASVMLIDRGSIGSEASWAGGGIVSPLYPWRYNDAVTALATRAQHAYPKLVAQLQSSTGIDAQLNVTGLMMLEADDSDRALAWAEHNGHEMASWSPEDIYAREPGLAVGFTEALWMPKIANVRNPRLLKALQHYVASHPNASIAEHCELLGLNCMQGRAESAVLGLGGSSRKVEMGQVIMTTGAWTGNLLQQSQAVLQVAPVKGQMLLYQSEKPLLKGMVLNKGRYLIPRNDNLILAGSTLEFEGFDKVATASAAEDLHTSATAMLPALSTTPRIGHWAGLRPGSPRGVPYIGYLPGLQNVAVNAGHYRNGLVLAPASAELLADIVMNEVPGLDPAPYSPVMRLHDRESERHGLGAPQMGPKWQSPAIELNISDA